MTLSASKPTAPKRAPGNSRRSGRETDGTTRSSHRNTTVSPASARAVPTSQVSTPYPVTSSRPRTASTRDVAWVTPPVSPRLSAAAAPSARRGGPPGQPEAERGRGAERGQRDQVLDVVAEEVRLVDVALPDALHA